MLARICYPLLIAVVLIGGVETFLLIDTELARCPVDYARAYGWLELARSGMLLAMGCVVGGLRAGAQVPASRLGAYQ